MKAVLWVCYLLYWAVFVVVVIAYNKKIDKLEKKIFELSVGGGKELNFTMSNGWYRSEEDRNVDENTCKKSYLVTLMERYADTDIPPIKRTICVVADSIEEAKKQCKIQSPEGEILKVEGAPWN